MSELRNNLEKLRDEYRSHRYPGSLAADLARRPAQERRRVTLGRIAAAASVITALAAAVVMWMTIEPAVTPVGPESPGGESMIAAADPDVHVSDLGAMPALPAELPLMPEAVESISEVVPSLSDLGGMPEMPSMDLNFSYGDDTETSEDSV